MWLNATEVALSQAKFAKIAERATRKGFTGGLALEVGPATEHKSKDAYGFETTRVLYDVTVTGEAPCYAGSTFLARLEVLESGTVIPFNAPGVDKVDLTDIDPEACSHCGVNRYRRNIYLVADADGNRSTVGSTCIKDFLGWNASLVWISEDEIDSELDKEIRGYRASGHVVYGTEHIIAIAYAATKSFGYVRAGAYEGMATKAVVNFVLNPPTKLTADDRAMIDTLRAMADEANGMASKLRNWILSDEFNGSSDYVFNLKKLCAEDSVPANMIGFLASVPQAYAKAHEIKAEKESAPVSNWVGAAGDKLTVTAEISAIRWIESDWGSTTLYTMTDADGNLFKWFASNPTLGEETGKAVTVKGTVKKHEEYKGTRATVLTRCKAI